MQPLFSIAQSKAGKNHIKLSDTRRATLARLALLIMRLRTNQYGVREDFEPWPIAALARHLNKGETNDPQRRLPARAKRAGVIAPAYGW